MKNITLFILFAISFNLSGQQTISGTFSPAKDYKWLIAYRLKPGTQVYVADTAIKDGKFTMTLPENSPAGTYRFVYAVPQEEYNFDVIYSGKEAIELTLDTENGLRFKTSKENIVFNSYFTDINVAERKLINFYTNGLTDVTLFQEITKTYHNIQNSYEVESKGLISHEAIKANKSYVPSSYESVQDYVAHKKEHYFKRLDFKNPVLQASGFLTAKIANYAFTALPIEQMTQSETEKAMQTNIKEIANRIPDLAPTYKFHIFYTLWTQASASSYNEVSDFIYAAYLKALAVETNNQEVIETIEVHNRLRFGATAPEMIWKDGADLKKLSGLDTAENYILIFWSSTCSHCLKELPPLHKKLKENDTVKVVAIGLEDDTVNWENETKNLESFEHAIALGKWESEYAKLYDIHQTPTYYILDTDKRIIAKPDNDRDVIEFLEKN